MGNLMGKIMGQPSQKKQAALAAADAKKAEANRPARAADEAKDSEAEVLTTESSEVDASGTDVAVVRQKKTARKGVPGLGL